MMLQEQRLNGLRRRTGVLTRVTGLAAWHDILSGIAAAFTHRLNVVLGKPVAFLSAVGTAVFIGREDRRPLFEREGGRKLFSLRPPTLNNITATFWIGDAPFAIGDLSRMRVSRIALSCLAICAETMAVIRTFYAAITAYDNSPLASRTHGLRFLPCTRGRDEAFAVLFIVPAPITSLTHTMTLVLSPFGALTALNKSASHKENRPSPATRCNTRSRLQTADLQFSTGGA